MKGKSNPWHHYYQALGSGQVQDIDLNKNVFDLTETYPELIAILKDLGFPGIANAVARNPPGRVTTIPQGCRKQGKELAEAVKKLEEKGFRVKPPT
ncbi:DUF1858 domain-containing protein [Chloroflexota bacterium]